jgi:hypothetical protein
MLISGLANAGKGLIFLLLPVLCSWGHMPVASMIQLSRVEFTQTDLSRLRAAIRLPQGLELQLGNSKLRVSVKVGGGEPATRDFSLAEIRSDQHALAPTSQRRATRVFACSLSVRATCRARRHFELSCWHGSRRAVDRGAMSRFQFCRMAAGSATGRMVRCASQLTCKPRRRAGSSSSRKISTCERLPALTR